MDNLDTLVINPDDTACNAMAMAMHGAIINVESQDKDEGNTVDPSAAATTEPNTEVPPLSVEGPKSLEATMGTQTEVPPLGDEGRKSLEATTDACTELQTQVMRDVEMEEKPDQPKDLKGNDKDKDVQDLMQLEDGGGANAAPLLHLCSRYSSRM